MKKSFMIEYLCRDEFRKKEESLKKYYMNENILFVYYPWFREGKFFGKRVKQNKVDEYDEFELYLPANEIAIYEKKFGALVLHYRVYYNKRIVMLMNIAPSERAKERMKELQNYFSGKVHAVKDDYYDELLNLLNIYEY